MESAVHAYQSIQGEEMIHRLKCLGLAAIAISAMGATVASGAQASSLHIVPVKVLTGSSAPGQEQVAVTRTSGLPNVFCSGASLEGTTEGLTITEATLTPTYQGCKLVGTAAQVLMNGCKYTVTGIGEPALTAQVDIVGCTAGKAIEIKTAVCSVTIAEQNGLEHLTFENVGGSLQAINVNVNVSGIAYTQDSAACPDGNKHSATNGTLTGSFAVKAFEAESVNQVTKHGHQYAEYLCGVQVGLVAT
jgi:hypothetical protein